MMVRVKLFAVAKEIAGREELLVEVAADTTIEAVRRAVEAAEPKLGSILPHSMWAVNAQYAGGETVVNEDSEVALIPPVSGG